MFREMHISCFNLGQLERDYRKKNECFPQNLVFLAKKKKSKGTLLDTKLLKSDFFFLNFPSIPNKRNWKIKKLTLEALISFVE